MVSRDGLRGVRNRFSGRIRGGEAALIAGVAVIGVIAAWFISQTSPVGAGVATTHRARSGLAATKPPAVSSLLLTRVGTVAGNTASYATFGSWDQHVVSNENGIFVAYSYEDHNGHRPDYWRLARSTDGGKTLHIVYDGRREGSIIVPPAIETDAANNVYVIAPTEQSPGWLMGPTIFYKFSPSDKYRSPVIHRLHIGGAGKYSTVYDPIRHVIDLLFWTRGPHHASFFEIDTGGVVRKQLVFYTAGRDGFPEYANLTASPNGTLFAGWTTIDDPLWNNGLGTQNYYDARFLASPDGGNTWVGKHGMVSLPVVGDDTGPGFQIVNTSDPIEFIPRSSRKYHGNWNVLMGFAYNGGYLDFYYGNTHRRDAGGPSAHESYARMNWASRTFDERISPNFGSAAGISLNGAGGSFSESRSDTGPLYFAGSYYDHGLSRLCLFVSDDHGRSWELYARSPRFTGHADYVNTARYLADNGTVIGSFTLDDPGRTGATVYFFRSRVPRP